MKYIAISLVFLNLAYFAYQSTRGPGDRLASRVPPLPPGPRLQLLSERDGAGAQLQKTRLQKTQSQKTQLQVAGRSGPSQNQGQEQQEQEEPQAQPPACQALGPLTDVQQALDLNERLAALGLGGKPVARDAATGDSDFRVLLPPVASLQEAYRRVRELKSLDIDSYVITQGEDMAGISLGVFSTLDAARRYQSALAAQGYAAETREIHRQARSYWIVGEPGAAYAPSLLAQNPGLRLESAPCD